MDFKKSHSDSLPFTCSQFPFLSIPKVKSCSHQYPRDSHWVFPIPILFPNMHSKTIKCSRNANSRQSSNRKTVPQKTGYQSLKKSKNNIHSGLKIRLIDLNTSIWAYSKPLSCRWLPNLPPKIQHDLICVTYFCSFSLLRSLHFSAFDSFFS